MDIKSWTEKVEAQNVVILAWLPSNFGIKRKQNAEALKHPQIVKMKSYNLLKETAKGCVICFQTTN